VRKYITNEGKYEKIRGGRKSNLEHIIATSSKSPRILNYSKDSESKLV
jgi:hypothetical protein